MSNVTEFVAAQHALLIATMVGVQSENDRQDAFTASALTTARALASKSATLQNLADANAENYAIAKELGAPKGTLYVSVEAVSYHGLTGDILALGMADGGDRVVPTSVQTLVVKVKRSPLGVKAIKAAIKSGKSVQDVVSALTTALANVDAAPKGKGEGEGESGEGNVTSIESVQTVESLLGRALAMVQSGESLTDAARALLAQFGEISAAA